MNDNYNKVVAMNDFGLRALMYRMWAQVFLIADLRRINRETRKIMVENEAKHPLGSTELLYLPRRSGGRGLKSVKSEYKITKIRQ